MAKNRSEKTSKKRMYVAPSGETRTEYHNRKHTKILCGMCGGELSGVPMSMKKKAKSEKVPNRPYAGNYCSACSRIIIKDKLIKEVEKK
ncbi:MAG: 50S ribosomal protein L34e [Candidatus Nanoarchaeia archaeon]|nr:50S ribosomal protein L34e [Candidatus Nanoarchaeia archaeon]